MRPQRAAFLCALLSIIGLGFSGYLAFLHIALLRGELLGGAACGGTGSIFNCHAVTASRFGTLLDIPLALWGVLGYIAAFSLSTIGWRLSEWSTRALGAVVALSGAFVLADLGLLAVMLLQIKYLCPLCLGTYAVNVLLLVVALAGLRAAGGRIGEQVRSSIDAWMPSWRAPVTLVLWSALLTGAVGIWSVHAVARYLAQGDRKAFQQQITQYITQKPKVTVETAGDPMLGQPGRSIQVVEFSDFLCPSCSRAWKFNPLIIANHRNEMSFVFKHLPLDRECNTALTRQIHAGSCRLAAAAECAHEQGKFWEFHDIVFEKDAKYPVANLEGDAARLGLDMERYRSCMAEGRGLEAVRRDLAEAVRLGINSTPTYVINGISMTGALTPAMFDDVVQTLKRSP